jgi:hypothetical protein
MGKSLLHYLDIYTYVVQEMTLSVAKFTILQWYMSDWVQNIGGMTLTGKIEVHLDLYYVLFAFLKQGHSVTEGIQPTENKKSQIK